MTWFHFDPQSFAFSFLSVLFESVPFLLLGALISGLIEVFVPARWMTGILPRKASPPCSSARGWVSCSRCANAAWCRSSGG